MNMQIESIDVTWIVKSDMQASFYRGEAISVNNQDNGHLAIRFILKNVRDLGEDPFEVILNLQESDRRFFFQADCYDNPEEQYPLRLLRSDEGDELLLICDDEGEQIFFSLC
ncbi:hypothetical protein ACSDBR_01335 [Acidithiobacillus ferriphilus]|uniref:hypothetical protein n=1 Tax=Acidithiobacillus ferriphilus TaxID=1689834 RepID=UPI003F51162F